MSSKNDKFYLKLALNLAKQHEGLTRENPSVGCVIVKNNKILSLSKTSINGRPHAEANAIRLANKNDLKGLPKDIVKTLTPYLGLKGIEAQNFLDNKELVITEEQGKIINEFAKKEAVKNLKTRWEETTKTSFDKLPKGPTKPPILNNLNALPNTAAPANHGAAAAIIGINPAPAAPAVAPPGSIAPNGAPAVFKPANISVPLAFAIVPSFAIPASPTLPNALVPTVVATVSNIPGF